MTAGRVKDTGKSVLVRTVDGVYPMLDGTTLFDHKGTIYVGGMVLTEEDFLPEPDLKALKGDFKESDPNYKAMKRMQDHLLSLMTPVEDGAVDEVSALFDEDHPRISLVHETADGGEKVSPFMQTERDAVGPEATPELGVQSLAT